jgi:catecholate siderophore receptor
VAVPSPNDPAVSVLVDAQRAQGAELDLSGRLNRAWTVLAAYAYQDAKITRSISATAQAGARLAHVPQHSFSLWNKYEITRAWSVGLGVIHRGTTFAATDNKVMLPRFTRVDGAAFYTAEHFGVQVNLENAFGTRYYSAANSNDNITPGAPRGVRVSLSTRF